MGPRNARVAAVVAMDRIQGGDSGQANATCGAMLSPDNAFVTAGSPMGAFFLAGAGEGATPSADVAQGASTTLIGQQGRSGSL